VKYTSAILRAALVRHGLVLERVARGNFLPQTLPRGVRTLQRAWDLFGRAWYALDRAGSRLPGINRVCGVLEGVAVKRRA
jgi:hypothetical protein